MRQFFCKTITLKKLLGRKFHVERTKLQTGCKNLTQNLQTFRYTASQRQKHLNLLYDFFHLGCSMSHSWFSYRSTIRAWIQKWAVSGFHYDHYAFNLSSLHVFLQSSALNIKAGVLPLKSGLLLCFGFAIHAALGTWKII